MLAQRAFKGAHTVIAVIVRNHLSATDAWREAAVGDSRYMCIRTASFEGSVSKQMVVKTDQPDDRHPQTKTRSALGNGLLFPDE